IFEHRNIVRRVRKTPKDILKRYEKWKDIVQISGPSGLRLIRGFNDEALRGDWKGHRSSRLGDQYRVIYRIEKDRFFVLVIDLAPHDYRRK
ncbi:MAG: type II toxin-antitoxin system mRNA interferase toxin, RelE/StbE family, partial [Gammaproteobacteria bacterium]|nr:type II toxin-antitoxin system mRNA interferase toxin, RelE/StbE family [Gammaproteobacteria bacterium]